jgi:hypothetical protein
MQNSYLKLKKNPLTNIYHPVLHGLEDAYRIINTICQVKVKPYATFPSPVTLIPSYPDLPMEHVYPRVEDTDIRELYLRETGNSRIVYFPGDIDRTYWQILSADHGKLLNNSIRWALNEEPVVEVNGPGVIDVTVWKQKLSMTVHLVNLTNPMLMKGPYRELIPVQAQVTVIIPEGLKPKGVHLLVSGLIPKYELKENKIIVSASPVYDHEIIGIDLE